jgi:hypothetical protein
LSLAATGDLHARSHVAEPDTTSERFVYGRSLLSRRPATTLIGFAVVKKGCASASALMEDAQLRAPRISTFNTARDGGDWASGSAEVQFLLFQDP